MTTAMHLRRRALVDRDAMRSGKPGDPIPIIAATEGDPGDGIDLRMSGARLDRYKGNPVIGYGHSYWGRLNLPVGRGEDVRLDGKKLRKNVRFDTEDEFAMVLDRKYRDGYLNAFSIGFDVLAWEDPKTQDYWRGGVAIDWELFETSSVPIPMDANALAEIRSRDGGTSAEDLTVVIRELFGRLSPGLAERLRELLDEAAGRGRRMLPPDPVPASPEQERNADMSVSRLAIARRRLRLAEIGI
jgi:hypothetical protein